MKSSIRGQFAFRLLAYVQIFAMGFPLASIAGIKNSAQPASGQAGAPSAPPPPPQSRGSEDPGLMALTRGSGGNNGPGASGPGAPSGSGNKPGSSGSAEPGNTESAYGNTQGCVFNRDNALTKSFKDSVKAAIDDAANAIKACNDKYPGRSLTDSTLKALQALGGTTKSGNGYQSAMVMSGYGFGGMGGFGGFGGGGDSSQVQVTCDNYVSIFSRERDQFNAAAKSNLAGKVFPSSRYSSCVNQKDPFGSNGSGDGSSGLGPSVDSACVDAIFTAAVDQKSQACAQTRETGQTAQAASDIVTLVSGLMDDVDSNCRGAKADQTRSQVVGAIGNFFSNIPGVDMLGSLGISLFSGVLGNLFKHTNNPARLAANLSDANKRLSKACLLVQGFDVMPECHEPPARTPGSTGEAPQSGNEAHPSGPKPDLQAAKTDLDTSAAAVMDALNKAGITSNEKIKEKLWNTSAVRDAVRNLMQTFGKVRPFPIETAPGHVETQQLSLTDFLDRVVKNPALKDGDDAQSVVPLLAAVKSYSNPPGPSKDKLVALIKAFSSVGEIDTSGKNQAVLMGPLVQNYMDLQSVQGFMAGFRDGSQQQETALVADELDRIHHQLADAGAGETGTFVYMKGLLDIAAADVNTKFENERERIQPDLGRERNSYTQFAAIRTVFDNCTLLAPSLYWNARRHEVNLSEGKSNWTRECQAFSCILGQNPPTCPDGASSDGCLKELFRESSCVGKNLYPVKVEELRSQMSSGNKVCGRTVDQVVTCFRDPGHCPSTATGTGTPGSGEGRSGGG